MIDAFDASLRSRFDTRSHVISALVYLPGELKQGWRQFIRDVCKTSLTPASNPAIQLTSSSMNSPEVEALLHRVQPDLLFVNCIAQRISQRIYQLPRLGTFIYHEGVTPEYRGVHSPFWALANGDDDKVGFTLLKCDDRFDGGEVYAQGAIRVDPTEPFPGLRGTLGSVRRTGRRGALSFGPGARSSESSRCFHSSRLLLQLLSLFTTSKNPAPPQRARLAGDDYRQTRIHRPVRKVAPALIETPK